MAYTAAAMYAGAAFVGVVEGVIPGGPELSLVPGFAALVIVVMLLRLGPRLPDAVLTALVPVGAAGIAYAIATTPPGQGEGALLYVWPVLWVAYFHGRLGCVLIVAWIGLVHAVALTQMPPGTAYLDRWLDVVISLGVVAVVVQALSERNRSLVERLEQEARVDKLTAVLNRRGLEDRADAEVERARREGYPLAAVTFDIDYFKRVNDEWGHDTGDRVLEHLGAVLRRQTRTMDLVARLGGEEFLALLPGVDAEHARGYAERVRAEFADGGGLGLPRVTVSAGVTAAAPPRSMETLLQAADSALYEAKRSGRDRTVVHEPAMAGVA